MKLKITTTAETVTAIKIEGELIGEGVLEFITACRSVDGPLGFDLTELVTADAEGVRALRELLGTRARLLDASPYIKLLLESEDT